jgi:hypothetical protein
MTRRLGLALALTALLGGELAAQQDTVPPERPFVPGGVYDKPYLTTLLGRTALGGYAEAHARLERADGVQELGFEAKRFNLFTNTRVSDFVRIGAELEIEEAGEEIKLEYAAIDVLVHRALTLRAGMILSPLGRFNLAHDSPRNEFTDRPLVATELLGVALSEAGVGVLGLVPLATGGRLTYEVYAVNGFGDGLLHDVGDGIRLPTGRQGGEDANHSPAVVTRVAASPRDGVEIGLSAHHGAYNTFEEEGITLDERRDLTIGVVDFELALAGVRVQGEGAKAWIDLPPSLEGLFAGRQTGWYVEAVGDFARGLVATMPGSFWTWKARLDAIDLDSGLPGDSREQVSLGVSFRPTRDTALKLDYVRGRSHDRFNNRAQHAAVLFSIATYF